MGIAHLLLSQLDEAIVWFEKARSPLYSFAYSFLAAIYALRGETAKAAENLAEAQRLTRPLFEHRPPQGAGSRRGTGILGCAKGRCLV